MKADLHSHSTASDGLVAPAGVLALARAQDVLLALTDHDTLEGALALAPDCIVGAEIAAFLNGVEVHLLAYVPAQPVALRGLLRNTQEQRRVRAIHSMDRLEAAGFAVDRALVLNQPGSIGRPHVARALVASGHARDVADAFRRFLVPGQLGYVQRPEIPVADVLAATHEDDGLVALAHPLHYGPLDLAALTKMGLDALEVGHPSASARDRARLEIEAGTHGLLMTAGSDFHGDAHHGQVGAVTLEGDALTHFLDRLHGVA